MTAVFTIAIDKLCASTVHPANTNHEVGNKAWDFTAQNNIIPKDNMFVMHLCSIGLRNH